jgi:thioester reductase-like protein
MILEEIANLPDESGVKALLKLRYVAFGGGPLKGSVGEKLAEAGVKLLKNYGLTEVGPLGLIFNPAHDTDWNYFTLRQDIDFKLIKVEDSTVENGTYRLVGCPAGWREALEIQDKLVSNPNNPHEFNPVGRADDLIILNTGEKVLPAILENLLTESSLIKAALAFGDGRFELGIIIEPTELRLPDQYDDFKSKIWPLVTEAGEKMDNHAQISSTYAIIVTPAEKKMLRSDKGSILRRDTIAMFEQEIEEVYMLLETDTQGEVPIIDMTQLEQSLRNLIQGGLRWKMSEWYDQDDLFELGMDSLQAMSLRRLILRSIPENGPSLKDRIGADFVYRFPSISLMAERLRSEAFADPSLSSGANLLQDYVNQYSTRISLSPKAVLLLTGGTGSLGSHLLAHLASLPGVAEIICLNRLHSVEPRALQEQAMASKGIDISKIAWEKITVLQTNTSAPVLGLQDSEYRIFMGKVTHILHNAWPMDFNRSISSFKKQFKTLQNLCNLALDANSIRPNIKPRILFTSSISVVGQYNLIHGGSEVPEVRVEDAACSNEFGYGQAKLVCERILENISGQYPNQIEAGYVRVGQISGSTTSGFWNSNEHFPALVKPSQFVGKFPPVKGLLSWLPVDLAAQPMSELLLAPVGYEKCMVFHLQNPIMQPTDEVYDVVLSKLGPACSLAESFEEWIELVCSAQDEGTSRVGGDREENVASNPAAKLAEFFRNDFQHMGDVVMGTAQARKLSPTLENMGPVSAEIVGKYVDYWKREGFLG